MSPQDSKSLLQSALGLEPQASPFPWQEVLLDRMLQGRIPDSLNIPTGLGKTSVMAIWLVARACGASLPRRLVYVVDRRAVVDQATDVAANLRAWVNRHPPIKDALGIKERGLPISTLRGQYVDNREWLEDPASTAIVVGTVDMVGSRLLFEGYAVSRKMRPYHAGLLGVDTLLVLDEAHLAPPFEHLLRSVATNPVFRPRAERYNRCVPPFKLLALSATGRTQSDNSLGLTGKDFEHAILNKRLNAKKSLCIGRLDQDTALEEALAGHAWHLADNGARPARVIVYSHQPDVARKAKAAVEKLAKGDKKAGKSAVKIETELFVGGRRVFERERAKARLEELGFIAATKLIPTYPTLLFATSAGEVGVDLDADHMVCDLVEWERMVQRLGRVNRRGEPEDHTADIVVVVEPEPKVDKKTRDALDKQQRNEELDQGERSRVERYNQAVRERERRQKPLEQLPRKENGCFDASVAALLQLNKRAKDDPQLQQTLDNAVSPEPLRPALTLPLVEAWSLTSLKTHPGRPAIQPWLRGWVNDPPQTSIVWRTYLPVRDGGRKPRKGEIEAFFEAAPPHTSELLETETSKAADWLVARSGSLKKQRVDQPHPLALGDHNIVAFVLESDGTLRTCFTLRELASIEDKDWLKDKLGGATLIVDTRLAGLKDGLLDHTMSDPPPAADGSEWLGEGGVGFRVRGVDSSATVANCKNWRERFRFASEISEDGEPLRWLVVDKWRNDAATEDDRSEGRKQLLDEHQERAQQRARQLAHALQLDREYEDVLTLAASLHDEGKRASRWQCAFNAPKDGPYAKTEGPINQGLLDGYRHEFGSLLRIENDGRVRGLSGDQRDLLLHLIAAHHGFARPVIGTSGCEDAPPSVLEEKAAEIALRFARVQARWGPWGLAWWETLLRAADQLASRDNTAESADEGGS